MAKRLTVVCLLALALGAAGAGSARGHAAHHHGHAAQAQGAYTNPVLDRDFADPMVFQAPDGTFYAYATQAPTASGMVNIQLAFSRDMVHWKELPDAMPTKPTWAATTQNFWAPHVIESGGTYYLYYAAEPDDKKGHALGVATSKSPKGPFKDSGAPLIQSEGFEAIDAFPYDDPATGKKLMYWGSGFKPLHVRELAPDRLRFAPGSTTIDVVATSQDDYENLIEAPWVVKRDGWYILFYSGDNCCGDKAHYAVMAARSKSAMGPFVKLKDAVPGRKDSVVLGQNSRWNGPGHNSIVTDKAGVDWIVYHAIDRLNPVIKLGVKDTPTRRPLLIDKVTYQDGWPVIENGSPSISQRHGLSF